jgi:HD-GYP domain-containing protein (c-di-GMP phosphodiesterase class II)
MSDNTSLIERAADASQDFCAVNQHCLQYIVRLAQEMTVVANCDVIAADGATLCAGGATVSLSIASLIAQRRLRQPLEVSLDLTQEISPSDIVDDCLALMQQTPALALLGEGRAAAIARALAGLPCGGPLTLLLTIAKQFNRAVYQQSLAAMIVSTRLAAALDLSDRDGDLLMLAALVKDIGESYIDPRLIDGPLAASECPQLVAHPAIGHAFLTAFTDFPPALVDCVLQHHERQDGGGYPQALGKAQISPLAALLGVADCAAAVLLGGAGESSFDAWRGSLLGERVAVALTLVPGEFPAAAVSAIVATLAPLADVGGDPVGGSFAQRILPALQRIRAARLLAETLSKSTSRGLAAIGAVALAKIRGFDKRLRTIGVYDLALLGVIESDPLRMEKACLVVAEVGWRLRHLARHVYWRAAQRGEDLTSVTALVAALGTADRS